MKNRRDFMTKSLVASAGLMAASVLPVCADDKIEENIFAYSKANPKRWKGKEGSHAPVITAHEDKITVETKHGMSETHYIVKHSIVTSTGEVLAENIFFPSDKKAISTFEIKGDHKKLFALSFCNLHDLWVSEFKI